MNFFDPYDEREWCDNFTVRIEEKRVWEFHTQPTTDDFKCQDGDMMDSGASACFWYGMFAKSNGRENNTCAKQENV